MGSQDVQKFVMATPPAPDAISLQRVQRTILFGTEALAVYADGRPYV